MSYSGLFKSRYPDLHGRDWPRHIDPEDLRVLVTIGAEAHDHGKQGGRALVDKYNQLNAEGKNAYMSKIGRIGAIATNIKRQIVKAAREEIAEEFNMDFRS